ncbi:MAG: PAS domain-containing protein, partial [Deltaproteobacteria bacterium]
MPGSEFSVRTESPLRTPRRPCACTRRHPVGEHDAESSPPSPPRRCTPAHAASRGAPPRHRVRQTTTGRRASVSGKINHGTTESDRHLRDAAVRRDMTEPKVLEDALRRSEEMYRVLFQKNPNPVWVCDAETLRILAVNEGAMRVYGYA